MVKVAPSLLASDFACLREEISKVEQGGADIIHVDVMDGHFVPNITMGPFIVEAVKRVTDLFVDVHLMIEEPEKFIQPFADAGADNITVHFEACRSRLDSIIDELDRNGTEKGISIKPRTSVEEVLDYKDEIDLLLLMSVEPGFGGQSFIESTYDKISQTSELFPENMDIEVDGGINVENCSNVADAGADILVAGTAIFKADDPASVISIFKGE